MPRLPTETQSFVEQRVIGKPLSPSARPGRREFAEKNAQAFHFGQPNSRDKFPAGRSLLVWSHYPDGLFFDGNARSEKLFDTFGSYIETIWKCTVQAIPAGAPSSSRAITATSSSEPVGKRARSTATPVHSSSTLARVSAGCAIPCVAGRHHPAQDFFVALELQKQHGLLTSDALNLASARRLGINEITTADINFDQIQGLIIYNPNDLAASHEPHSLPRT